MKNLTKYIKVLLCMALFSSTVWASDDDIETRGVISFISESQITVAGVTYILNSGTEYEGEDDQPLTREDFVVGDFVKVSGERDGDDLIADEVERENDEDDDDDGDNSDARYILRGIVTAYNIGSSITIGNESFIITNNTEFEGDDDQIIDPSEISVGEIVKVKAYPNESNQLVAKEIEIEDSINDDGDDDDDDKSSDDSRRGEVRLICQVNNLKAIEDGLKKSIEQAFLDAGATRAKASVKAKVVKSDTDAPQSVSPIAAIPGLNVVIDLTNNDSPLSLSGDVTPSSCSATIKLRIKVVGSSPLTGKFEQTLNTEIVTAGIYSKNNRGRR